ncbi:unnamed protein product [Prorocentrum cordatum]|uniref:RNase H type-1 domain-containing protein n=1 Tax=Prorocentrum cordatum TaxID=2364126 RepID=A0ABN9Y3J1_9DINO|nr:unnamed protein product [Polarella glacialis]
MAGQWRWNASTSRWEKKGKQQQQSRAYVVCEACSRWKWADRLKKDPLCVCGQVLGHDPAAAHDESTRKYTIDDFIKLLQERGGEFALPTFASRVKETVTVNAANGPSQKSLSESFKLRQEAVERAARHKDAADQRVQQLREQLDEAVQAQTAAATAHEEAKAAAAAAGRAYAAFVGQGGPGAAAEADEDKSMASEGSNLSDLDDLDEGDYEVMRQAAQAKPKLQRLFAKVEERAKKKARRGARPPAGGGAPPPAAPGDHGPAAWQPMAAAAAAELQANARAAANQADREILREIIAFIRVMRMPYILGGDFNMDPSVIEGANILEYMNGTIIVPDIPYTNAVTKTMIDYFIVDDRLATSITVEGHLEGPWSPHYGLTLTLEVEVFTKQIWALERPAPLPRALGPARPWADYFGKAFLQVQGPQYAQYPTCFGHHDEILTHTFAVLCRAVEIQQRGIAVSDIEYQAGLVPRFAWKPLLPPAPKEGRTKSASSQWATLGIRAKERDQARDDSAHFQRLQEFLGHFFDKIPHPELSPEDSWALEAYLGGYSDKDTQAKGLEIIDRVQHNFHHSELIESKARMQAFAQELFDGLQFDLGRRWTSPCGQQYHIKPGNGETSPATGDQSAVIDIFTARITQKYWGQEQTIGFLASRPRNSQVYGTGCLLTGRYSFTETRLIGTDGSGEITAAIYALALEGPIVIVTDSDYLMKGVRRGEQWKHKNNTDLWCLFWQAYNDRTHHVAFKKTKAHATLSDISDGTVRPDFYIANVAADAVARRAAEFFGFTEEEVLEVQARDKEMQLIRMGYAGADIAGHRGRSLTSPTGAPHDVAEVPGVLLEGARFSSRGYATMLPLCGGTVVSSASELNFSWAGLALSAVAVLLRALKQILQGRLLCDESVDSVTLCYYPVALPRAFRSAGRTRVQIHGVPQFRAPFPAPPRRSGCSRDPRQGTPPLASRVPWVSWAPMVSDHVERDVATPRVHRRPGVSGLGFLWKVSCGLASTVWINVWPPEARCLSMITASLPSGAPSQEIQDAVDAYTHVAHTLGTT